MKTDTTYNGYKNYETWNVALWINNTESLYNSMVRYAQYCKRYSTSPTYTGLLGWSRLFIGCNGDGVSYKNKKVSRKELTELLFDGLID